MSKGTLGSAHSPHEDCRLGRLTRPTSRMLIQRFSQARLKVLPTAEISRPRLSRSWSVITH